MMTGAISIFSGVPTRTVTQLFDCRVQRYFVEGMIRACEDFNGKKFHPVVDKIIPPRR